MKRPLRRLAEVFAPAEAETPFGGRAVAWEPVCVAWLAVLASDRSETSGEGEPPSETARMRAETRADPRLARGLRVELDGAAWRLLHAEPDQPRPGRTTLTLERER